MRPIPAELSVGPFTRAMAEKHGVTARMLDGQRFTRVFPGVWRLRDHEMTEDDWVAAAAMALPDRAHLTGISRLQRLGLDYGPKRPLRFVIEGDHHLDIDDIFLHRTKRLPPTDDVGVTIPAAFIAYCAEARVIDAIKVGDWLLHEGHMAAESLRTLALSSLWRPGAHEAIWILDHLDDGCRSLKESETKAVLEFAGLERPGVNMPVDVGEDVLVIGDLFYQRWGLVVEYEGSHHQRDRGQYVADLDRYALLRAADLAYVQVTHEKLSRAKTLVGEVYRALLARGYDGPQPEFGERWRTLFMRLSQAIGPRRDRRRAVSGPPHLSGIRWTTHRTSARPRPAVS
jgi:hypothetical protein